MILRFTDIVLNKIEYVDGEVNLTFQIDEEDFKPKQIAALSRAIVEGCISEVVCNIEDEENNCPCCDEDKCPNCDEEESDEECCCTCV